MNAKIRGWIRNQTAYWERRATEERDKGDERISQIYRSVAREFRVLVRTDPWLAKLDPTPSVDILAQQIYESFTSAAYESGQSEIKPETAMPWKDVPQPYREAMMETAGDVLKSGMIELMVGETMHRERTETGERALRFWREFQDDGVSMKKTAEKMKRLAEGYVDD